MEPKQKVVLLFSGGLDSTVLLSGYCTKSDTEVEALYFNYGSKHMARERYAAYTICDRFNVKITEIALPFINELFKSDLLISGGAIPDGHYEDPEMKRTIVPYRNTIMLAIAAGYAKSVSAQHIAIASHKGDVVVYPDCRAEYFDSLASAFLLGAHEGIVINTPFVTWCKARIVNEGKTVGAPMELSWSCYKSGALHCGKCGTCVERIEAFKLAGGSDPTKYEE